MGEITKVQEMVEDEELNRSEGLSESASLI